MGTGALVPADVTELIDRLVEDVPDFPKAGVVFKDLGPLLADAGALAAVIDALAAAGRDAEGNPVIDKVVGMESRGFIFGAPVAVALGAGFVPVRKPGKLPAATHTVSYTLEYGEATLEVQANEIVPGDRVLIVDDVLATGGAAAATVDLIRQCGAEVQGVAVVLELSFLHGRDGLDGVPLTALRTL
jgi:adenine phosphoribosyltransferase